MTEQALPPLGWYPDPHDQSQWRWWNGQDWTDRQWPLGGMATQAEPPWFVQIWRSRQPEVGGLAGTAALLLAVFDPGNGAIVLLALLAQASLREWLAVAPQPVRLAANAGLALALLAHLVAIGGWGLAAIVVIAVVLVIGAFKVFESDFTERPWVGWTFMAVVMAVAVALWVTLIGH